MNEYSEQILQAIDLITQKRLSQLEFDKTIQAKIYSIVDLDTGEYKVRYNGNIFSAFCDDPEKTYRVDDEVYVNVPEGNFSNRKLIVSTVSAQSISYAQMTQLQNTIVPTSSSMTEMYPNVKQEPYQVVAGTDPQSALGTDIIYQGSNEYSPSDFHGLFQQYASQYNTIRIACSFLTQFHCVHTEGNYGIEVEFFAKEGNVVSYRLDLTQFNGDPYGFVVYAPQYAVIEAPTNYLVGLKSVKLFQEGFTPDHIIENGVVTDKENLTSPNIFAKDLSIQFVEVQDLSESSYYLSISTPQGIAFSNTVSSLDLVGRILYQGNDIYDAKRCECKWYERDLSVVIGAREYDKLAGFGWRQLEEESNRLSLTVQDVACRQKYKLIIIYNKKITLSAEVEISNQRSPYNLALAQDTQDGDVILRITDETLFGNWYVSFPDGTYMAIPSAERVNSVVVSPYMQYSSIVVYCAVETADRDYLGAIDYTLTNSTSEDDIRVTYTGDDTFRYDANGDVSVEEAERDRTLQAALVWKQGSAASYSLAWLYRDGNNREIEVPRTKDGALNPDNSMMEAIWVDNYNVLHYNIKQKYKVNYTNNTLVLRIATVFGDTYFFDKEILFLKDGDQGTNGTTYVALVRPCTEEGVKLSGLQPLVYNDGAWENVLNLKCYVYKDGELINNDTSTYSISYRWQGINLIVSGEGDQVIVSGSGDGGFTTSEFYVKSQVTIVDKAHESKRLDIYTFYPVDVACGGIDYSLIDIDEIPSYIKYTPSGINPQFYNRSLVYRYNGEIRNELMVSLNTGVLTIEEDSSGNKFLSPAPKFLFDSKSENNIGVLELRAPASALQRLLHPIIMYLDTYGNEQINGWDGTKVDVNEDGHYIFAPQIGAGGKDSSNRFSGVVMGKDSAQDQMGLYGYSEGVNTFGLMEDGTAFFGAPGAGGRIYIDGRIATLSGGDGGDSETGMTITLANLHPDRTTDAIKIGGGVFKVTYDGALTSTSADIQGKIYAQEGQIGCDENRRGGWTITANRLYSGTGSTYVALDSSSDPYAFWVGSSTPGTAYTPTDTRSGVIGSITNPAPFVVTRDGFVCCRNASIKGHIECESGQIGGWTVDKTKLSNTLNSASVGMAATGNAAFWAGQGLNDSSVDMSGTGSNAYGFLVTRSGKLYCKSADIGGNVTATGGTIGGWKITSNRLESADQNFWISPTYGLHFGSSFSVNQNGTLSCSGADITGTLRASALYLGGSSALDSSGRITAEFLNLRGLNIGNGAFVVNEWGEVSIGARASVSDEALSEGVQGAASKLAGWTASDGTHIDGQMIMTGTVYADKLRGQYVYLYTANDLENPVGHLSFAKTNNGISYGIELATESSTLGGIRIDSAGNLYLAANPLRDQGAFIMLDGSYQNKYDGSTGTARTIHLNAYCVEIEEYIGSDLVPEKTRNAYDLGNTSNHWNDLYLENGTIQTSDLKVKKDVETLPMKYFDMIKQIRPVRYRLVNGQSGRYHIGFIAQEVKAAMDKLGIDSSEFAGYIAGVDENNEPLYMLRYEEFNGIIWKGLQEILARLDVLENEKKENK